MALPSYWQSAKRKDLAELAIVKKREREAARIKSCEEVASFHRNLALKSAKYKYLEEEIIPKTPRANEESLVRERILAEKKEKLETRRRKLAHLFEVENEQYMKELKEHSDNEREKDPWNIARLKEQINDLQRKRREGEANMQKRYMHHLYRCSTPCLKEKEEDRLQKEVEAAWEKRKEELVKQSLAHKEKEKERINMLEIKKSVAIKEAQEAEKQKLEEEEKWKQLIGEKQIEIDKTKTKGRKLKLDEQILRECLDTLISVQDKRKQIRDLQQKGALQISALRQPKEKLRMMAVEIHRTLDADYKTLNFLKDHFLVKIDESTPCLLDLEVLDAAKQAINDQMMVEKERNLHLQQLFHEEACKLWDERKETWIRELLSRDNLMQEVFNKLIDQVKEKLATLEETQKNLVFIEESCRKEIAEQEQKWKQLSKEMSEKINFYLDQVKRLQSELKTNPG